MSSLQYAVQLKEEGNLLFKQKNYDAAIRKFSEAIALDPRNATFYGNRAACFYFVGRYAGSVNRQCELNLTKRKLLRFHDVITDSQTALQLNPRYAKAWLRKADAHDVRFTNSNCCYLRFTHVVHRHLCNTLTASNATLKPSHCRAPPNTPNSNNVSKPSLQKS